MIALVLLTVLNATPDALTLVKVDPKLSMKAPTQWTAETGDNEKSWVTADDSAKIAISVFPVDPVRPARSCVQQLVESLGTEGFAAITVGTQPASKKVVTDFLGEKDAEKTDANKVTTTTIVGCNGRTKWLLTFSAKTADGVRFGPVLKRILESVSYTK